MYSRGPIYLRIYLQDSRRWMSISLYAMPQCKKQDPTPNPPSEKAGTS